jgi:NAD kinase
MKRTTENKIILVVRRTRTDELKARFNTLEQAKFYVEHQGADFSDYLQEDEQYKSAIANAENILSNLGRVHVLQREFLPNFVFGQQDTVVVLGQDGLVANTVKYLNSQPVIGVNPDPQRWDGVLLPFQITDLNNIIPDVFAKRRPFKEVTMAKAILNNGQELYGVNDLFIGPKSHISARYLIRMGDHEEQQSSSGIIVSTGLGSTGWFKSLMIGATGITQALIAQGELVAVDSQTGRLTNQFPYNCQFPWDAEYLHFTVREPFPSATSSATLLFGKITAQQPLVLISQLPENGVIFSDGIEHDFLEFNSGTQATINLAEKRGYLVI